MQCTNHLARVRLLYDTTSHCNDISILDYEAKDENAELWDPKRVNLLQWGPGGAYCGKLPIAKFLKSIHVGIRPFSDPVGVISLKYLSRHIIYRLAIFVSLDLKTVFDITNHAVFWLCLSLKGLSQIYLFHFSDRCTRTAEAECVPLNLSPKIITWSGVG